MESDDLTAILAAWREAEQAATPGPWEADVIPRPGSAPLSDDRFTGPVRDLRRCRNRITKQQVSGKRRTGLGPGRAPRYDDPAGVLGNVAGLEKRSVTSHPRQAGQQAVTRLAPFVQFAEPGPRDTA